MSWPLDARNFEFQGGLYVPADTMNEIQDRVVDLHRERTVSLLNAHCPVDGSSNPGWYLDGNPQNGWKCQTGGVQIAFPFQFREGSNGAILKRVRAKVRNSSTATLQMDVYRATVNMGSPTTAPSLGASQGTDTSSGTGAWDVLDVSGLTLTVTADRRILIVFSSATASDNIATVQVTFEPLTPTP